MLWYYGMWRERNKYVMKEKGLYEKDIILKIQLSGIREMTK